ncbi:MAG: hypothetical protein CME05_15815 [Gemmatimonadaceae bacterium]|nr:hypothetical protein [Gemmatimonadaceae bacterium]
MKSSTRGAKWNIYGEIAGVTRIHTDLSTDKESQRRPEPRRVAGLAVSADTLRINWSLREFLEQPNEPDSMIDYTCSNHPERHDRSGPRWLSLETSTLTPV